MIIEDGAIVRGDGDSQICTNVRQSQFGDGPVNDARYSVIERGLRDAGMFDRSLASELLRQVAQRGGSVKTVYSYIYESSTDELTLYYLGNFSEMVRLNVGELTRDGRHTYHIPSMFAYVTAARPGNGSQPAGEAITFSWNGAPTDYLLSWSTDPSFSDAEPVLIPADSEQSGAVALALLLPLAMPAFGNARRRKWLLLVLLAMALTACLPDVPREPWEVSQRYRYQATGFEPGTTYYWRLQTERTEGIVATFDGGAFTIASP